MWALILRQPAHVQIRLADSISHHITCSIEFQSEIDGIMNNRCGEVEITPQLSSWIYAFTYESIFLDQLQTQNLLLSAPITFYIDCVNTFYIHLMLLNWEQTNDWGEKIRFKLKKVLDILSSTRTIKTFGYGSWKKLRELSFLTLKKQSQTFYSFFGWIKSQAFTKRCVRW